MAKRSRFEPSWAERAQQSQRSKRVMRGQPEPPRPVEIDWTKYAVPGHYMTSGRAFRLMDPFARSVRGATVTGPEGNPSSAYRSLARSFEEFQNAMNNQLRAYGQMIHVTFRLAQPPTDADLRAHKLYEHFNTQWRTGHVEDGDAR